MRRIRLLLALTVTVAMAAIATAPVSAQPPPFMVAFNVTKYLLTANGVAVHVYATVQCDAMPNDADSDDTDGTNGEPQSFQANVQISQKVSKTVIAQGFGNFFTDPTQDWGGTPFCDGTGNLTNATTRSIDFYVFAGGGGGPGGGSSAPFKVGTAFAQGGANECNYQCMDNNGNNIQPRDGEEFQTGTGFQNTIKIVKH